MRKVPHNTAPLLDRSVACRRCRLQLLVVRQTYQTWEGHQNEGAILDGPLHAGQQRFHVLGPPKFCYSIHVGHPGGRIASLQLEMDDLAVGSLRCQSTHQHRCKAVFKSWNAQRWPCPSLPGLDGCLLCSQVPQFLIIGLVKVWIRPWRCICLCWRVLVRQGDIEWPHRLFSHHGADLGCSFTRLSHWQAHPVQLQLGWLQLGKIHGSCVVLVRVLMELHRAVLQGLLQWSILHAEIQAYKVPVKDTGFVSLCQSFSAEDVVHTAQGSSELSGPGPKCVQHCAQRVGLELQNQGWILIDRESISNYRIYKIPVYEPAFGQQHGG